MTGPEHYAEAERILAASAAAPPDLDVSTNVAAAQVHATLALVAATAASRLVSPLQEWATTGGHIDDIAGEKKWREVTG